MKSFHVALPEEVEVELKEWAWQNRTNVSVTVRNLVIEFLKQQKEVSSDE